MQLPEIKLYQNEKSLSNADLTLLSIIANLRYFVVLIGAHLNQDDKEVNGGWVCLVTRLFPLSPANEDNPLHRDAVQGVVFARG